MSGSTFFFIYKYEKINDLNFELDYILKLPERPYFQFQDFFSCYSQKLICKFTIGTMVLIAVSSVFHPCIVRVCIILHKL